MAATVECYSVVLSDMAYALQGKAEILYKEQDAFAMHSVSDYTFFR